MRFKRLHGRVNKGTVEVPRVLTARIQSRIYTQALHPPDILSGGFSIYRWNLHGVLACPLALMQRRCRFDT